MISLGNAPDLLTTNDLCELLGHSDDHVRIMLRAGELPGVKIGARWYVPKSELEKFLTAQLEANYERN